MSFLRNIKNYKKKVSLVLNDGSNITYEELLNQTNYIKKFITKRSLVIILTGNNYETIASYVSLINLKSVVMLIDKNLNNKFLKNILKNYQPDFIFSPKKTYLFENFSKCFNLYNYEVFKNKFETKKKLSKELAVLLTTSGSTGNVKFVRQSYKNYEYNSKDIIKSLNIKNQNSVITTLPISYTFGLSVINTHLLSGNKIILNENSILSRNFWELYNFHKPSYFYGVPYIFKILDKMKFKNFFTPNLKVIANAGGEIETNDYLNLIKKIKSYKKKFFYMYGQTEATARMSILNHKFVSTKVKSIGKPIGTGKFKLLNEQKQIIKKTNYSGTLYFLGKNVCLGYAKSRNDLSKKNSNNFVLDTGDIAKFDKSGFYYIVGRKKRIIKIFGHRVDMDDVEKIMLKMGHTVNCLNKDDKIMINYNNKNLDIETCKTKISKQLKINLNYIKFIYLNELKKNNKIL